MEAGCYIADLREEEWRQKPKHAGTGKEKVSPL